MTTRIAGAATKKTKGRGFHQSLEGDDVAMWLKGCRRHSMVFLISFRWRPEEGFHGGDLGPAIWGKKLFKSFC